MMLSMRIAAIAAAMLLLAGCDGARRSGPEEPRPGARRIPATVLTVRTTVVPGDTAYIHKVVIAGTKARLGNELDRWRLFDLEAKTVTAVDAIAKTYRTEPFAKLLAERRRLLATPLPPSVPVARYERPEGEQVIAGIAAAPHAITMGGYRREIWISTQPTPADALFPMILATEPIGQPYAGVMRQAFAALVGQNGYPLLDRSEMRWDDKESIIEKRVVKIEQTTVPAAWLEIPPAFKDVTPRAETDRRR